MSGDILRQAVIAIRGGDRERGRQLLIRVLKDDSSNQAAWLWVTHCVDKVEHKRECFERVLDINPSNEHARQGLCLLDELDELGLQANTTQGSAVDGQQGGAIASFRQRSESSAGKAEHDKGTSKYLKAQLEGPTEELPLSQDGPNGSLRLEIQRMLGEKVFGSPIGCWGLLAVVLFGYFFANQYEEQGVFWKALGDTIGGCCMGIVLLAVLLWAFNKVGSVLPD